MMSTRKRKNSADPGTERNLSKRAKLLSDLWQSQEETGRTTQGSQSNLSSPVYRIKAIIGERSTEYLIDWADDPVTGERFKPDWVCIDVIYVLLHYVTALAVQLFASLVGADYQSAT